MSLTATGTTSATLRPEDARAVAAICPFDGLDEARIRWELDRPEHHVWLGRCDVDGRVVAAHRGLVWSDHLLLKGVCLAPELAGTTAALGLGMAMRTEARERGLTLAAWVEPSRPEAHLARRLRLVPVRPDLVHRYLLRGETPVAADGPHPATSGRVRLPHLAETPLGPDLLASSSARTVEVRWTWDRGRLVLSAVPAASVATLTPVLAAVAEAAGGWPSAGFELPLPAADLATALLLTRSGAHRVSRTPVQLATEVAA